MESDNTENMRIIGLRLRVARLVKRSSLKELEADTGVNFVQISEIERGKKNGSFWAMVKICQALNISIDDLTEGLIIS